MTDPDDVCACCNHDERYGYRCRFLPRGWYKMRNSGRCDCKAFTEATDD
jgi:hypothetical protein